MEANESKKTRRKPLQVINMQSESPATGDFNIIMPRRKKMKAKDILAIHSQLIKKFMSGEVVGDKAKTLSYLCSSYLNSLQVSEYEERIEKLEKQLRECKK